MITIQTKNKITKAQADNFNDSQEENGLTKLNPTSKEDCYWMLKVEDNTLGQTFKAKINWYQLQEYDTGNEEDPIGINDVLIYKEDFELDSAQVQNLWEAMEGEILSSDNYLEKVKEFTAQGVLIWCGTVRNIFEIGIENFEVV